MLACRACTRTNVQLVDIFRLLDDNNYPLQIAEALFMCCSVNVVVNDLLPKYVCQECCSELWRAFKFRKICQQSELYFKKKVAATNELKKEEVDISFQTLNQQTDLTSNDVQLKEENPLQIDEGFETVFLENNSNLQEMTSFSDELNYLDIKPLNSEVKSEKSNNNGVRPRLKCLLCSTKFSDQNSLNEHYTKHSKDMLIQKKKLISQRICIKRQNKEYICDICGKICKQLSHIKEHMRMHSREIPFECNECGKQFMYSSSLHQHMRKIHGSVWHACNQCGIHFKNRSLLRQHLKLHNSGTSKSSNGNQSIESTGKVYTENVNVPYSWKKNRENKPKICENCGKLCKQTSHLNEHMRKHTKESPFVCHECGKAFSYGSSLRHHMINMHGGITHNCKICKITFKKKFNLTRHIKSVHKSQSSVNNESNCDDKIEDIEDIDEINDEIGIKNESD